MAELPPSLTVKPNIPWSKQTLEQLIAERDYWDAQINDAAGWGAAVSAMGGFRNACAVWIERRRKEAENGLAID